MTIAETGSATNGSGGTAVTITHGLTINEGDVVVAVIHTNTNDVTITDNNGSNPFVDDYYNNGGGGSAYSIQTRVAGASEPSSYAWTLGSSQSHSVIIRVFSGVDNASVWDVVPADANRDTGASVGSPFTITAPSITTSNADAMGILLNVTDSASATFSTPTNSYGTEVEHSANRSQVSYIRTFSSAGATGASSMNMSGIGDFAIHQVALKNDSGGAPAGNPWNYYAQQ